STVGSGRSGATSSTTDSKRVGPAPSAAAGGAASAHATASASTTAGRANSTFEAARSGFHRTGSGARAVRVTAVSVRSRRLPGVACAATIGAGPCGPREGGGRAQRSRGHRRRRRRRGRRRGRATGRAAAGGGGGGGAAGGVRHGAPRLPTGASPHVAAGPRPPRPADLAGRDQALHPARAAHRADPP